MRTGNKEYDDYNKSLSRVRKIFECLYDCKVNDVKASKIALDTEITSCLGLVDAIYHDAKKIQYVKKNLKWLGEMGGFLVDEKNGKFSKKQFYDKLADTVAKKPDEQSLVEINSSAH